MNKRLIVIGIVLLSIGVFFFKKDELRQKAAPTVASKVEFSQSKPPIDNKNFATSNKKSNFIIQSLMSSSQIQESTSGQEIPSECLKRIQSQATSQSFAERHQAYWNQIIGEWYFSSDYTTPNQGSSIAGKFFLALAYAGLLDGKEIERDDERALTLLAEVFSADPTNSAPLIYAAIIEKRKDNHKQAEDLLTQARSTSHFNSYLTDITQTIFEQAQTGEDLIQAYSVWSALPIPNYLEIKNILKGNPAAGKFAQQMMRDGLQQDTILADIDWIPIEYAVGKKIVDGIQPANRYPDYKTLYKAKSKRSPLQSDRLLANLKSNCNLSSLDSIVHELREFMARRRPR